jgi:predicted amidohydrolase
MDLAWEDWKSNHAGAAKLLKRAADDGASLALLPEMFATGFSMDGAKIAQPPGGPSEQWLRGMARGLGLNLIAGLAETCDASGAPSPLPCNNALWVTPEGDVSRYTKRRTHLKKPFTSRMKSRVPGAEFCTLTEPDPSSASCRIPLLARVWPGPKEIE